MAETSKSTADQPWWLRRQLTWAQRNSLTDEQLLARYRHRHGNPYMPLGVAKQMRSLEAKYAHLGAAYDRRRQTEIEVERAQLRRRLFPAAGPEDSA